MSKEKVTISPELSDLGLPATVLSLTLTLTQTLVYSQLVQKSTHLRSTRPNSVPRLS